MRQIFRVKNATPSGIVPARNSNANLHSFHSSNARTLCVPVEALNILRKVRDGLPSAARRAFPVSHQIQRHFRSNIDFVQQATPMEFAQACFLVLTEIKEKVF